MTADTKPEPTGDALAQRYLDFPRRHATPLCSCGVPTSWTDRQGRTVVHSCDPEENR